MIQNAGLKWFIVIVVLAVSATAAQAVTIETVPVGNLGNANDTRYEMSGHGGVDYAYNIGKYEVTAGQYTEFLNAVAATDTHGLYNMSMWLMDYGCKIERSGNDGGYSYSVADDRKDRPVNYVSFWDAARFCNWLQSGDTESGAYVNIGNQDTFARQSGATWFIPTEDEWYKAAYHQNNGATGDYFDYPTGSDAVPSNDLTTPDDGNNANFYQDGGYTIDGPYYTTPVGEFENSESPYGTFDQGGNVFEWNETAFGSSRGLRGGSWYGSSSYCAASVRGACYSSDEGDLVGFRVASVPEPGSIALLACGLLTGLIWWRRRGR